MTSPLDSELPRCRRCGGPTVRWVLAADRHGSGEREIRRCRTCRLGQTDGPPVAAPAAPTALPGRGPLRRLAEVIIRAELAPLRGLPPGTRVLDAGAGSGGRSLALHAMGYAVTALEPDPDEAAAARRALPAGVPVVEGTLEAWPDPAARFGAVLLSHVLEHTESPVAALAAARDRLRGGGLLVVTVPNAGGAEARAFRGRWHGWEPARHRWHFTVRGLRSVLAEAGYADVRVRARGGWRYPASLAYSLSPSLDPQVAGGVRALAGRAIAAGLVPVAAAATLLGLGPQLVATASPPRRRPGRETVT